MIKFIHSHTLLMVLMGINACYILLMLANYGRARTAKEDFETRATQRSAWTAYRVHDLLLNVAIAKTETMKQALLYAILPAINGVYFILLYITKS